MRIFVLEDDARRVEILKRLLVGHDVTWAEGVTEGLQRWTPPYKLLLLDHDLGGDIFVDSGEPNTGYQFLKSVIREIEGSVVVVHSYNPAGAGNMHALAAAEGKVAAAMLAPFGPALMGVLEQLLYRRKEHDEEATA